MTNYRLASSLQGLAHVFYQQEGNSTGRIDLYKILSNFLNVVT